jgi:hypothetical protein
MKTKLHYLFIALALLALSTLNPQLSTAFAQGTAFTYQGQLSNSSGPASGTYDLTFKLWNASSAGGQVGGTLTASSTVISNGLFTVILDFGGVFNGLPYWLELGVRTNGAVSFATLSPRQELTPTPYAITAQNVTGVVLASQLTGTLPSVALSGTYAGPLTLNNAGNNFSGNGSGLTGVALLAGTNTFSGNQIIDGMLEINDGSGEKYFTDVTMFSPTGYYPGEQHSINFDDPVGHIGSLIVGYEGAVGYFSVGNLLHNGVHPTNTTSFTVTGVGNVIIDQANYNSGSLNNGNTNGAGLSFGSGSGEGIASKRTAGGNQYGLDFYTSFANRMSILNNGFVGINTTNPASQLEVNGDTRIDGNLSTASLTVRSGGNIQVSGAGTNTSTAAFIQVATAANTSYTYMTTIHNPLCDGDPNAILIATHRYNNPGGGGTYETHPYSVWYDGSHWTIYHDDYYPMATNNLAFNVLIIKRN